MEEAWQHHWAGIRNDKLTSAAACKEHVRQFELQVVSDGLRGTVLDGCVDAQALIATATFEATKGDVSLGLYALAVAGRDFKIRRAVEDILELAKPKAVKGHYEMVIKYPYAEIKSYNHAENEQLCPMSSICSAVEDIGLHACLQCHDLRVSWTKG
jgi:hypothetical protein